MELCQSINILGGMQADMTDFAASVGTRRPPLWMLALTELPRTMIDMSILGASVLPLLGTSPRGDGHPVLVIPGLAAGDGSTLALRTYLRYLGYDVYGWELGRNFGPRVIGAAGEKIEARLAQIYEETGRPISVVGWSLGGLMARILARRQPSSIRQIITLGSGFAGPAHATHAWRLYELVAGQGVDHPESTGYVRESSLPSPVPSTAIYSCGDGIVSWENCREQETERAESIRVRGSHCGLGFNASVFYAIADRLAQPEGTWRPFERPETCSAIYPDS